MASRRNVSREMNKLDVSSPESQISQDRQVDPPPVAKQHKRMIVLYSSRSIYACVEYEYFFVMYHFEDRGERIWLEI